MRWWPHDPHRPPSTANLSPTSEYASRVGATPAPCAGPVHVDLQLVRAEETQVLDYEALISAYSLRHSV